MYEKHQHHRTRNTMVTLCLDLLYSWCHTIALQLMSYYCSTADVILLLYSWCHTITLQLMSYYCSTADVILLLYSWCHTITLTISHLYKAPINCFKFRDLLHQYLALKVLVFWEIFMTHIFTILNQKLIVAHSWCISFSWKNCVKIQQYYLDGHLSNMQKNLAEHSLPLLSCLLHWVVELD